MTQAGRPRNHRVRRGRDCDSPAEPVVLRLAPARAPGPARAAGGVTPGYYVTGAAESDGPAAAAA